MKNFFKAVALCLVLAMTFAMVPVLPVFAADADYTQIIEVDGTTKTLATACSEAQDGALIKLTADVSDSNLKIKKNVTIDGQGKYTINETGAFIVGSASAVNVTLQNLTLTDTSAAALGSNPAISVRNGSNLTLNNCTVTTAGLMFDSEKTVGNVVINSGTYTSESVGIFALSNKQTDPNIGSMNITINGGTFVANGSPIFVLHRAATAKNTININGGTFKASNLVQVSKGAAAFELNINNTVSEPTFDMSSVIFQWTGNAAITAAHNININAGTFKSGSRMFIMDNVPAAGGSVNVDIKGGTFVAGQLLFNKNGVTDAVAHNIKISGGDFKVTYEANTTRGGIFALNGNTKVDITGGTFTQEMAYPFVLAGAAGVNVNMTNATVNMPELITWVNGTKASVFDGVAAVNVTMGAGNKFNKLIGYAGHVDYAKTIKDDGVFLTAMQNVAEDDANLGKNGVNPATWNNAADLLDGFNGIQAKKDGENYDLRVLFAVKDVTGFDAAGFIFSANGGAVLDKNNATEGVVAVDLEKYYTTVQVKGVAKSAKDITEDDAYANGKVFAVIIEDVTAEQMASATLYVNFWANKGGKTVQSDVAYIALSTLVEIAE